MTTRIFRVEMEHVAFGARWSIETVVATHAAAAITKAERAANQDYKTRRIRAVGVTLLAEAS